MVIGIPVTVKLRTILMNVKDDLDFGRCNKPYRNDVFTKTLLSIFDSIDVSLLEPINNEIKQYFYRRWI